jgi:pentose-5-phosphate-3-epimerase
MNMMSMQWLSDRMDQAVSAIKDQQDLEAEVHLLIKTSASLIDKLEKRDKELMHLRSELMLLRQQLAAFTDIEAAVDDE